MEGLELFTPTVSLDSSSSESSESEGTSDTDYRRGVASFGMGAGGDSWRRMTRQRGQRLLNVKEVEEEDPLNVEDVDDDRNFEIEKVS